MPVDAHSAEKTPGEASPTLPLMHATFLLAGLGTMLLGPILPLLTTRWHLQDAQSGLLLLAQFCGATLGGVTVSARLRPALLIGLLASAVGFTAFAFAPGLALACGGLFVGGFGVGRIIATVNFIAGARYTHQRASSLSRLNFSWSFGALLSPLLAAWLTPRQALPRLLASFAALFLVVAAVFLFQLRQSSAEPTPARSKVQIPKVQIPNVHAKLSQPIDRVDIRLFLYFLALLFVYGGLETCLSGWLTTYAIRYGQSSLLLSEYTMVLLLAGLTAGRALAAWLLLKVRDRILQRSALLLAAVLTAALAAAHQAAVIATLAVLLGVSLAPIFPATFALIMAQRPSARQAGIILAASGLGAAALPWLMGVLSTQTGSLHLALLVPVAAALAMFLMSLAPPSATVSRPRFPEPSVSV